MAPKPPPKLPSSALPGTPPSARLSKSAFIRAQPPTMKAKDVVAAARQAGLHFSENYVYTIRGKRTGSRRHERLGKPAERRSATGSKSALILSTPRSVPAKTLVEQAKAQGLTLTEHYIYKVRALKLPPGPLARGSAAGRGTATLARSAAAHSAATHSAATHSAATHSAATHSAPAHSAASAPPAASPSDAAAFRSLVVQLGAARCWELLAKVEQQLATLVAGR